MLYTDNFFNSVPLHVAQQLLDRQTFLFETLTQNRKQIPETVASVKLKKVDIVARRSRQIAVAKWKGKRDVLMLSTVHAGKIVEGRKRDRRGEIVKNLTSFWITIITC